MVHSFDLLAPVPSRALKQHRPRLPILLGNLRRNPSLRHSLADACTAAHPPHPLSNLGLVCLPARRIVIDAPLLIFPVTCQSALPSPLSPQPASAGKRHTGCSGA